MRNKQIKEEILFFSTNSLNDTFSEEMVKLGYLVTPFHHLKINYPTVKEYSFWDQLLNIFYRLILKDKNFPHRKQKKIFNKWCNQRLKDLQKNQSEFDAIIFFRGDLYEKGFLEQCKKMGKRMVSFQADGISASYKILEERHLFDEVFCFDPNDSVKYKLHFLTNCILLNDSSKSEKTTTDVFYLGTYTEERARLITSIERVLNAQNIQFEAVLNINHYRKEKVENSITYTHRFFDYKTVLENEKSAKCILDLVHSNHSGLSFRFFEALEMQKKIITNNQEVLKYEFYQKNNIFVLGTDEESHLHEFINTPYQKLDPRVVEKYKLENWLKIILNKKEAIRIQNPIANEKI